MCFDIELSERRPLASRGSPQRVHALRRANTDLLDENAVVLLGAAYLASGGFGALDDAVSHHGDSDVL